MTPRPTVMLYNEHFATAGGGERSTFDLAQALDDLGFDVLFAFDSESEIKTDSLLSAFGIEPRPNWQFLRFSRSGELHAFLKEERIDLFVNHSFGSFLPKPCKSGLYVVMFPQTATKEKTRQLRTYERILCNSSFTEYYVKRRWGQDLPLAVLHPPISSIHFVQPPVDFCEKERLILSIGRFNVFGHSKRQLEVIRAFCDSIRQGVIDDSWRLVVAGHMNSSPETEDYLAQCRLCAEGYPVEILTNVSIDALCAFYRRASYLWQFTGLEYGFGSYPERCEHLGLVSLDSFAYGVLPIVYERSGIVDAIDHGKNGYLFGTLDELRQIMRVSARSFGSAMHCRQFTWSRESAANYNFANFRQRLRDLLPTGV